jgi:tetrahydromethanopterin S-methyltransferase subunit E
MINYINKQKQKSIMKPFILLLILIFGISSVQAENVTYNETSSLGVNQFNHDHPLYIDFSKDSTTFIFLTILIIILVSFVVEVHLINSLMLLFISIILMGNGFNLLLSFFIMLISIFLIVLSRK